MGRLAVLERELESFLCLQELDWGRVYIEWWLEYIRRPVIERLLQLNSHTFGKIGSFRKRVEKDNLFTRVCSGDSVFGIVGKVL